MKKFIKKSMLSLGVISMIAAGMLYAEEIETPPTTSDTTVETPPGVDSNTTGDDHGDDYVQCEYRSYFSPFSEACVAINPVTKTELTTGVWLDVVVDKSTKPPTPTSEYSGCNTFTNGAYDYDINVTSIFVDENNQTEIETPSYASYDESNGMLSMQFESDDNTTAATSTDMDYEELYLTREGNNTFVLRRDMYSDSFMMDGVVVNNTTNTCSELSSQLVFENDYFNPNLEKDIQVTGHISLPDDIDAHRVSVQAVTENWNWISHSNLDTVEDNKFTLGFDNAQQVAIQVNFETQTDGMYEWYEYFYTASGWERADWSKPMSDYLISVDGNMTGLDLNISAIFASQVKLDGNITYESDVNVYLEFINMNNGMYFGWQELKDSDQDFSVSLPSTEIGDKYMMRVSLNSPNKWESYFIDFRSGTPVLVPENNIEWNNYIKDASGVLQKSDTNEWQEGQMWLPDFTQTGYLELTDTDADGSFTKSDLPAINLSFSSDALDDQFYIVEGNVTVPSTFIPGEVTDSNGNWMGWNNVNFEVMDKTSGDWITWAEIERSDLDASEGTNTYKYKIKLDKPTDGSAKDIIMRVNYEYYEDGISQFNGYYISGDGNLTSDRKIEHTPILNDWDGNPLVSNGKTNDQCWDEGNFWWQEKGSETGTCYDEHPSRWIADVGDGFISLSETDPKSTLNIDFVSLASDTYKVTGEITVPAEFVPNRDWNNRRVIMIEAINADTGMWLANTEISENAVDGKPNTYKYSLQLQDVDASTNIIIKLIKEESTSTDWNWEAYYLVFSDDANLSNVSFLAEENVQWKESNVTDDWGYNAWVPDVGANSILDLDENNKVKTINVDYTVVMANYTSDRQAVKGIITLAEPIVLGQTSDWYWNNIRVELINKNNGDWIGSDEAKCDTTPCTELSYDIDLPGDGNYIVKIIKEIDGVWEEYYYNFGADYDINGTDTNADKLVDGQKVDWVEAQDYPSWGGTWKNWMPNPSQTGWLDTTVNSAVKQKVVNVNFSTFESSQLVFAGTVTVPFDFEVGSFCTKDGVEKPAKCDWEEPANVGYNNWYGSKNLRIEAMNASTGEYIASTDLRAKVENTNDYEFKLTLGELNGGQNLIIRINKESSSDGQWKFDEIYYNFGTDNAFTGIVGATDGEKLVNGKKIPWVESNTVNEWGYKNWMPDVSATGFIALSSSVTDFNADISQLGANDLKIKGTVTFKSDFNLSNQNSFADVSAIDATTGMWVGNTPIESDGSYELNLGEETGEYILQVNYSYNDYNNWQNSWWKNKYYDFGADKAYGGSDDQILNDNDVRWVPKLGTADSTKTTDSACWRAGMFWDYEGSSPACYPQPEAWVPNVSGLTVATTVSDVNIDLSAAVGNTLNIEITNFPAGATNKYVMVVNPLTYSNIWQNMDGNSTSLTEVKDGNYTVEFGYEVNGQWKNFFMAGANNSAISGNEVRWTDLGNNVWGPDSSDTTYLYLTADTNISITMPAIVSNTLNVTVTGLEDAKNVSADFRSVSKPYGAWEQNTSAGTSVGFTFADIKNDDFILSFWYDGNEYVYDNATPTVLKKDPEWVAKNSSGTIVCGGSAGWDCNWNDSVNWMWTPDVTPLTINQVTTNLTLALPVALKVTGAINLSSDFANKNVYVSIFNGNDWNWKDFVLDAQGDVNGSIKVSGGNDYRIEIWVDGLGGYVYTTDLNEDNTTGDNGWISQMKSWDETTWQPKVATLIDISANLPLETMSIGSDFKTVTISMENLDTQDGAIIEDVWVSLESNTLGYFGDGNANWEVYPATYDSNITLKVPAGDYKLLVFPMNHRGGFLSDDSSGDNTIATATATFTKIGWGEADSFTIDGDEVITVSLPSLATLKEINGTVVCKDTTDDSTDNNDAGANCEGWIDAWSGTTGKGSIVNANGTFTIKGLEAANYNLTYWSFDQSLNGLTLESSADASSASVNNVVLKQVVGNTVSDINGTVTKSSGTANSDYYVVLIEVTDANTWEIVATKTLDANGNFQFGARTKPSGKSLVVAVASRTFVDGASTIGFDGESATEVFDASANIALPTPNTDLADTFSITIH